LRVLEVLMVEMEGVVEVQYRQVLVVMGQVLVRVLEEQQYRQVVFR
jgi:hypothetical protein